MLNYIGIPALNAKILQPHKNLTIRIYDAERYSDFFIAEGIVPARKIHEMEQKIQSMKLTIDAMSVEAAVLISRWVYPAPYSVYSQDASDDCRNELLDGNYFSVYDATGNLLGYYCVGEAAQVPAGKAFGVYDDTDITDIGLGMNPEFCGQGRGLDFVNAGLTFVREKFAATGFRLTVAVFNQRAIKVYEKAGFRQVNSFVRLSQPGEMEFLVMTKGK